MESLQTLWGSIDTDLVVRLLTRILSVVLCLSVHEMSHALVANALGDPTAKDMERLSLNPFQHIDWFGLMCLMVAGFGWAKPVPVDMRHFKNPKRGMALTALAGPASNFVFAALCLLPVRLLLNAAPVSGFSLWLMNFLISLAILSLGMGLFNLIPFPPMDGSKVLFSFLPDSAYYWMLKNERVGMIFLMMLVFFGVGSEIFTRASTAVFYFFLDLIVL